MLKLVTDSFEKPQSFFLLDTSTEMKAGSMPGNNIYLPFKGVSREHFIVERKDSDWVVIDLGSRNGTHINGKRIAEAIIRSGDEIQAGTVKLTVEEMPEESDAIFLHNVKRPILRRDTAELTDEIAVENRTFYFPQLHFPEEMIPGNSAAILEVYHKLHSIASGELNVLFIGETGTGKEILAKTLHLSGLRAPGPFVAVNCAAIAADLAESELFGIGEKVATHVNRRTGKMELAHGGTLLLDELSSFPIELQAKVLRTLEEKVVYPVGENRPHQADFRLISTCNEDPKALIESGRLREDLYHRIATVEILVPPLRERQGDIESLVVGLVDQISARENKPIAGLKASLLELLRQYSYPGNIRELLNILKSMIALANPGDILDESLIPEKVRSSATVSKNSPVTLHAHLDEESRKLIQQVLKNKKGSITEAAQQLGVTPRGLRKMMQRLGLKG
jgi:transcriptional regulator with PAS, ATPase and Fis domain